MNEDDILQDDLDENEEIDPNDPEKGLDKYVKRNLERRNREYQERTKANEELRKRAEEEQKRIDEILEDRPGETSIERRRRISRQMGRYYKGKERLRPDADIQTEGNLKGQPKPEDIFGPNYKRKPTYLDDIKDNDGLRFAGGLLVEIFGNLGLDAAGIVADTFVPGAGTAIQAPGSAFFNWANQKIRGEKEINQGEMAAASAASLIPGLQPFRAATKAGRFYKSVLKGGTTGAIDVTGTKLGRGEEVTTTDLASGFVAGGLLGSVFGIKDGGEAYKALKNKINKGTAFVADTLNLDGTISRRVPQVEELKPATAFAIKGRGSLPKGGDLSDFLASQRNRYDVADESLRKANIDPKSKEYARIRRAARQVPEFVRRNDDGFLYFDYRLFRDSMRPKQYGRAYIELFETDLDVIMSGGAGTAGTKAFKDFNIAEFRETFKPAAELLGLTGKYTPGRMDVSNVHHIAALKGIMGIYDGLGFNSPMYKRVNEIMKESLDGLGSEQENFIRLVGGTADVDSPHYLAHLFLSDAIGPSGEKFFTDDVLINMSQSDAFRESKARELGRIIADSATVAEEAQAAYKRLADAALATDYNDIQETMQRLLTSKQLGFVKTNNVNYKPFVRDKLAEGGYRPRQFDELIEDISLIHKAIPTGSPKLIDEILFTPQLRKAQKSFQKLLVKIEEKFGGENITAAQMRKILDAYDIRMQNAGEGQTGLFEDLPDNLIDDTLNTLQKKLNLKKKKK